MKIGGLQPVTLLDYPGKVAATIFTSGCNMRCPFCYNPNLVLPEMISQSDFMPEETVKAFLEKRKKYLDGICVTGGEPLIQPDIVDFLKWIKDLGYMVKLDTNGLAPKVLAAVFKKKLVDYVAMDIKGPLSDYEKFAGVKIDSKKIEESIFLIINSGTDYEFRSTLVKGLHSIKDIQKMSEAIKGAKKYYLQTFDSPGKLVGKDFSGRGFSPQEMKDFCALASQFVVFCGVRQ